MPTSSNSGPESALPCTWQPETFCQDCEVRAKLMCRWDKKDFLQFFLIVLPFAASAIAGAIHAGTGWYLFLWLAYSLFFFFVWEARVLCRHCPFWAEPGKLLRCHANYGVIKLWRYDPGPMRQSEKTQFIAGALIWMAFPFPLLLLGGAYLFALAAAGAAIAGAVVLRKSVCRRCVNFSCPMNAVPAPLAAAYLGRNPRLDAAWQISPLRRR